MLAIILKNFLRPPELSRHFCFENAGSAEALPIPSYTHKPLIYLVQVQPEQRSVLELLAKRIMDLVLTFLGLIALAPLMLVIALIIKTTSKGPVIYSQIRVGVGGRLFKMYKFRSMVENAEALQKDLEKHNKHRKTPVFKVENDPRVTRFGSFIRKYSLDELPQLFNVLRNDMSIVGPRPPVVSEVEKYEPWQLRRLAVQPGLTCIWQVSGRSNLSFEEWMQLDLQYIKNWSLWLDIKLILLTFRAIVSGHGAY
jgi:exopolysaccharide biosynthesis polyprenyl glycosylphosphotransferase